MPKHKSFEPTVITGKLPLSVLGNPPHRRGSPRIVLPASKPDMTAIRSFMRDCLIPILAQEFLRRRDAAEHTAITVSKMSHIGENMSYLHRGGKRGDSRNSSPPNLGEDQC